MKLKLIFEQLLKNDNDMYCENCGAPLNDGAKTASTAGAMR